MNNHDIFYYLKTHISFYGLRFIYVICTGFIGWWIVKKASNGLQKAMQAKHIELTVSLFVRNFFYFMALMIIVIMMLSELGVPTTSLIAILATVGLAVALSLQSSLSNLASGLLLIVFRPFKVGQSIQVKGVSGTVQRITILYTEIMSSDNQLLVIPNSQLTSNIITNDSTQSIRRLDLVYFVYYTEDIDAIRALLNNIIQGDRRILLHPAKPLVVVQALKYNAVQLLVQIWLAKEDYTSVTYAMNEAVKKEFIKHQIKWPSSPQEIYWQ